jgi:hypothetical protein
MDLTAENYGTTLAVPMVDPEVVRHLRALRALGWGKKRIARELGISVKRRAALSARRHRRRDENAPRRVEAR